MAMFDDLIPAQQQSQQTPTTGGLFDDLIPAAPSPAAPPAAAAPVDTKKYPYSADNWPYDDNSFVSKRKTVNGVEYRLHKTTGAIYAPDGTATDDPEVMAAFGKTKLSKRGQARADVRKPMVDSSATSILDNAISSIPGIGQQYSAAKWAIETGKEIANTPQETTDTIAAAAQSPDQSSIATDWQAGSANVKTAYLGQQIIGLRNEIANLTRTAKERPDDQLIRQRLARAEEAYQRVYRMYDEASGQQFPQNPTFAALHDKDVPGTPAQKTVAAFRADPWGVSRTLTLQSGPVSIPSVAGGIIGSIAAGRPGAAIGAGVPSAYIEAGLNLRDQIAARGADMNDPASRRATFEKYADEIIRDAQISGLIVGAGDAAGAMFGSGVAALEGKGASNIVGKELVGTIADALFGAAGEGGKQVYNTGGISDPQSLIDEGLGEVVAGGVQQGGMLAVEGLKSAGGKTDRQVQPPGQRTEPRLFDDLVPSPQARTPATPPVTQQSDANSWVTDPMAQADVLRQTGYSFEQIADMNPAERAQAAQEARQQGVQPLGTIAPEAPAPGTSAPAPGFGTRAQTRPGQADMSAPVQPVQAPQATQQPHTPGATMANGFKAGHEPGIRYRVTANAKSLGGKVLYEKRSESASPSTFYVGNDGGMVDANTVNVRGNDRDRLWTPRSEDARAKVADLLDRRGLIKLNSEEDLAIKDQVRQIVLDDQNNNAAANIQPTSLTVPPRPQFAPVDTSQNDAADKAFDTFIAGRQPITAEGFAAASGLDINEAGRAIQRAMLKGRVIQTRGGKLRRPPTRSTPIDAMDFIASIGGIRDVTGELAGMDLPKMGPFGPPVRKNGLHPDQVLERLVEGGYLQDPGRDNGGQRQLTVNAVYDLIARHMGGQKAYSIQDQAKADAIAATKKNENADPDYAPIHPIAQRFGMETWEKVQAFFADSGTAEETWSPQEVSDAARLVAQGMDAGNAFERAAFMQVEDRIDPENEFPEFIEWLQKRDKDAIEAVADLPPFPDVETPPNAAAERTPEASPSLPSVVEEGNGPQNQADAGSDTGEVPGTRPVRGEEGQAGPVTAVEPGADNRPQTVIPGAEAVSEADAAKAAKAEKARKELEARRKQSKLRKSGQESVEDQDGGLFGGKGPKQSSLLDAPTAPEPKSPTPPSQPNRVVIETGVVLRTKSGRETSPAPKIDASTDRKATATIDRMNAWLLSEARMEAEAIGSDWQKTLLRGLDIKNFTQSDQDTVNDILFGDPDGPTEANVVRIDNSKKPKAATSQTEQAEAKPNSVSDKPNSVSYGTANTLVTADRAAELRAKLKAKLKGQLNAGIDPEMLAMGAELAAFHIEAGARRFTDFAKAIASDLDTTIKAIRPYLRSWYNGARDMMEDAGLDVAGMDTPDEVKAALADLDVEAKPQQAEPSPQPQSDTVDDSLVSAFRDFFGSPENSFATITEARKFAAERGFEAKPGTPQAKELDERLEQALVLAARDIVKASKKRGVETTYSRLVDLYGRQPNLGVRTSESMADQAYSTPAPLAFLASRLAGVVNADVVYEPTAGNGMLLIEADRDSVVANELNERRRNALKAQGFKRVTGNDASLDGQARAINNALNGAAVVIENPPFGIIPQADGSSKTFHVDGWKTTQIDHAIALTSLKAMRDDGRAVLIVGSVKEGTDENRSDAYNSKQKREFYYRLYKDYNVTDHFTVAGDLYKRQGAGWPVDVIVIEGRGKSQRRLPAAEVPKVFDSWDSLKEKLANGPAETQSPARPADVGGTLPQPVDNGDAGQTAAELASTGSNDLKPSDGKRPSAKPSIVDDTSTVPAGRPDGQRPDIGEQQPSESDGSPLSAGTSNDGFRDRKPAGPARERVRREQTDTPQLAYQPMSSLPTLDTKIPTNMADAVETSLQDLADRHGDLDTWIETELGYGKGELRNYLAAEQVDAVAMALDNVQKGAAFIIGDQTGIGKGRVVASALRYAMRKGLSPVFITEKPNLYGDIIRDLNDIGIGKMLGRDLRPFLTNSGLSVPLDDDAVAWFDEAEKAKTEGQKQPAKRGKFLRSSSADAHKKQMASVAADGLGRDKPFDIVFTTYDQMNTVKGETTDRRRLIDRLSGNAFLVLDESHNAGGTDAAGWQKENAPQNRSDFLKAVTTKAKAVMFSSATYAKRPQTMALYARTDMGKAVERPDMLGELIARGGVPMQQVVASMLAKAGQYIRRERSFDGVAYDVEPVPVDEKSYEAVSTSLARIAEFDKELKKSDTWKEVIDKLKESAEAAAFDSATGGASVTSTNFTSLMHNIVGQMLLAIKADSVATRAIEALKAGEKPVITVANTMGAFIKSYAEENNIKRGDDISLSFRDVLSRYLMRTLRLTVKSPDGGETRHVQIPLNALPSYLRRMYNEASAAIASVDTASLPISPIDWMRHRVQKAGYRVAEITGRKEILEYGGVNNASFSERLDSEVSPAGRRVNIDKFNRGDIDVMILNRAGSTGLSLHASSRFKDQKRRRMIIAQAELNIDVHMQMLGRVHRTGQVVPPAFSQAYADVPAEARPAAVLAKKMASLNANTTATRKSAFSADDGVDFLNQYGDQVAREFLSENIDLAAALDIDTGNTTEETARVLTGKLLLLPIAEQKRALDEISTRYKLLIENLDAMGENALEAKTVDLKAKTISRDTLKEAEGESPFTQAVTLEETEVKASGKALPIEEVLARASKALTGVEPTANTNPASILNELDRTADRIYVNFFKKWTADHARYTQEIVAAAKAEDTKQKRREQEAEIFSRFRAVTEFLTPGKRVVVRTKDGEPIPGIIMEVKRRDTGATGNPLALGAWTAEIAIPDNAQRIIVPFSSVALPTDNVSEDAKKVFIAKPDWAQGPQQIVDLFANARKEGKETRFIITGNILAGFDQTRGQGQIVNYTDDQGNVKPGILMNRQFSAEKFKAERAVRFKTASQVLEFIGRMPAAEINSRDRLVMLRADGREYEFELPAGRGTGGTYFLNPKVREAASDRFVKVGSVMRHTARDRASAERVLQAMMDAGALFQTTEGQDVAESIIKATPPQAPLSSMPRRRANSTTQPRVRIAVMRAEIRDIASRILGHQIADVQIVEDMEAAGFSRDENAVYDPNTNVITIALDAAQDPRTSLRHEAIHALRQAGVFTPQEWAALARLARTRWIDQHDIRNRYERLYRERFDIPAEQIEELLVEEAIAEAFADYRANPRGEDLVSRIFDRVMRFLEAVANMARGHGYRTSADVFEAIDRGDVAGRQRGQGQSRDFLLYGREELPLSSRGRTLPPPRNAAAGSFEAPHDERVLEALTDSTATILERIRRAGASIGNEYRRKAQDREVDLLRTQGAITKAGGRIAEPQDAYLAASLYPGRVAQRDRDLVDDVIEPLIEEIARRGLTLDEVDQFNRARHAFERNLAVGQLYKPGEQFHDAMYNSAIVGGSGLSDDQAGDILNGFQSSGKYAALEAVGDKILALNRRTIDSLLAEGLLTQEQHDAMTAKYQYYVPLRGYDEATDETHPDAPRTGSRYDVRGQEVNRAFGRTSQSDSPLAYSIMQARQAIIRIEKNRVGKRFLRLAQANPNEAFWQVNRRDRKKIIDKNTGLVRYANDPGVTEAENVLAVKVGGQAYHITMHHRGLAAAMKGMGTENMHSLVVNFHKINRYLASMYTSYSPEFIFTNLLRDLQQTGIVLQEEKVKGITRSVLAAMPKAAAGMNAMLRGDLSSPWARYAREYADAGGKMGFMGRNDIETEKRSLERLMREQDPSKSLKAWMVLRDEVVGRLDRYNDSIENTLRLSTYVALRNAGVSRDKAAFSARELTINFNRKGEWSSGINAFYLFFNAASQGAASLAMRFARSKTIRRVCYGIMLSAFAQDMLNRMIAGDDDDGENRYDKIPDEIKARNGIVMFPKWLEDKTGVPYLKWPLPLGYNMFHVIGTQVGHAAAGARTPLEAAAEAVSSVANAFNPLGGGGTILNFFSPTLLDPAADIATNTNSFGENIIPRVFDETTPYAERYKDNVNPAAKWITETLSQATGGSPERKGGIDWSPEWVEHVWDFAAGGVGRMINNASTTTRDLFMGADVDATKVPFARTFVGQTSKFADRDAYYEIKDAVHVTQKEIEARQKEGDTAAVQRIQSRYARELRMIKAVDEAEKNLAKLRRDMRAVKALQTMGAAAKRTRIDEISRRMDAIQLDVRRAWNAPEPTAKTSAP